MSAVDLNCLTQKSAEAGNAHLNSEGSSISTVDLLLGLGCFENEKKYQLVLKQLLPNQ